MKKRIHQVMGSFQDFATHLKQANEWALACPSPKTCHLSFRVIIKKTISVDILPYVWQMRGNVLVEVRKLRRQPITYTNTPSTPISGSTNYPNGNSSNRTIGQVKQLTIQEFYIIYCFLSDIKTCAAHTITFTPNTLNSEKQETHEHGFDETECQICMDNAKQVVLPCTHSFCLYCFQHWSAQSQTCPLCRAKIDCSEGSELWQLTCKDIEDIGTYSADLMARIYEFLEKRQQAKYTEEEMKVSRDRFDEAQNVKIQPFPSFSHTELLSNSLPVGLPYILRCALRLSPQSTNSNLELDTDLLLALELASGEDQFAAWRYFEQQRRDHIMATTIAMQVDEQGEIQRYH